MEKGPLLKNIDLAKMLCVLAFMLLTASCNMKLEEKELDADTFVKFKEYGLVKGRKYLFKYNESTCQMVNNRARRLLRMQSDTQNEFVNIVFGESSSGTGNMKVEVELAYKLEKSDGIIRVAMEMVVLKSEEMKVWLWSKELNMGLIVSPVIKKTD